MRVRTQRCRVLQRAQLAEIRTQAGNDDHRCFPDLATCNVSTHAKFTGVRGLFSQNWTASGRARTCPKVNPVPPLNEALGTSCRGLRGSRQGNKRRDGTMLRSGWPWQGPVPTPQHKTKSKPNACIPHRCIKPTRSQRPGRCGRTPTSVSPMDGYGRFTPCDVGGKGG
jgi:hypothetical protein